MRIAYLIGRYPSVSHTFVLREVRELRRRGLGIDTFSIWRSSEDVILSEADREEFESTHAFLPAKPLEFLAAHGRALMRPGYLGTLWAALRLGGPGLRGRLFGLLWFAECVALWRQCELRGIRHVHAHLGGTASAVALLTARFGNGRNGSDGWSWSMTVHGPVDYYEQQLAAKARAASFVICISDYARSQIMVLVDEAHWPKLHVVHCGVDVDTFSPRRERASGDQAGVQILTVGRLDRMKGQAVLLEAVAALNREGVQAELVVVGEGPKRKALEEMSRGLGLDGRVDWRGAVGQDSIREYYAAADVFCLASFAEGVPVVLMEAMATEVPVVATRITGIPELVDDGVSGLLVGPGRADQLAAALKKLASDSELGRQMGRAGRETVAAEYDIRKSGLDLERVFKQQLASETAAPPTGAPELP